jgi:uncharacterized protein with PQ loop repeat
MDVGELIGWSSALLLLPTFGIQTLRQWQARHEPAAGTSLWFFILAFVGTGGQVIYSAMVGNRVYFALNACLVVTNCVGLLVAIHRWQVGRSRQSAVYPRFPRAPSTPANNAAKGAPTTTTEPNPDRTGGSIERR